MASDLERGAYSGRETKLYYNSATNATPTWAEIKRARNVQHTRGPALSEVEFHGGQATVNIPGYDKFSGSFEYVRKRGTDTVFDALETHRNDRTPVVLQFLNDDIATSGASGFTAPVLLGEFSETKNGGDGVVVTIPFGYADAVESGGDSVLIEDVTIA